MSQFPGPGIGCVDQFFGGWALWPGLAPWGGPYTALTMDQKDQPELGKVKPKDATDRNQLSYSPNSTGGLGYGVFGDIGQASGYDPSPPSSPGLFWWIRKDPMVVIAFGATTKPLSGGTRSVEIVDDRGNPDLAKEMKESAEKDLLPVMATGLIAACECLNFGLWLQEGGWDKNKEGRIAPVTLDSVLPGEAVLHCDPHRHFAGFEINNQFRDKRYAWHSVNQPHIHPVLGYARLEAVKYPWWGKLNTNLNANKIEGKASGIQMLLGVPMGKSFTDSWIDSAGVQQSREIWPAELCQRMVNLGVTGASATYPLYAFKQGDIAANPELATVPGMKIDRFDWGNQGPMLEAERSRLDHLDQQIMYAYGRPPRESTEGQHGTKAEAESHAENIGIRDSETVHQERCDEYWNQVGMVWRRANYGDDDKTPVLRIEAAPLADEQQSFLQEGVISLLTDRMTGPEFLDHIGQRDLLGKVEMPMVDEETAKKNKAARIAQQQSQNPPGGSGDVPPNGDNPDVDLNSIRARLKKRAGVNGNGQH